MGLGANEIVLSPGAAQSLERFERSPDPASRSISRRIRALRPILLADCLHGEVLKKDRIPRALREKYGLENLYIEDLPSFWRLLSTIVRSGGGRYIVIVEILDHGKYSRWFPGRGA